MIGKIILGAVAFSFLPIWRGAGKYSRHNGATLWQLMDAATQTEYAPFGCPHIKYEDAVARARLAYQQSKEQ